MKTRCLIVDDEPLSIKLIRDYLNELSDFFIAGDAKNAIDAMKFLENETIDLLIIDINMPRISGLDLLKSLQNPPKVIIISAYKEYALDGFELNVIDFLLKPISFDRFLKAINKYKGRKGISNSNSLLNQHHYNEEILSLKDNKKVYNFRLDEILYFESMREYVKVNTKSRAQMIKCALSKIDEVLPSNKFMRIHKSYLIPIDKVESFSATFVEINDKRIPIGRHFKSYVIKQLNNQGKLVL